MNVPRILLRRQAAKRWRIDLLNKLPVVGEPMEHMLGQFKEALKTFFHGGMLFEEMGFRYIGPVDGHDIESLQRYLTMVKDVKGPVLLHVFTDKGHGFEPAQQDPVKFHTPAPFCRDENDEIVPVNVDSSVAYTNIVSDAIYDAMKKDDRVCVLTAAMCAGNKLGKVRDDFADRFFDTAETTRRRPSKLDNLMNECLLFSRPFAR